MNREKCCALCQSITCKTFQKNSKKFKNEKKKKLNKKKNIPVTPHHAAHHWLFVGASAARHSHTSQTIWSMTYLFVVKGERGQDLPGPDVQI